MNYDDKIISIQTDKMVTESKIERIKKVRLNQE